MAKRGHRAVGQSSIILYKQGRVSQYVRVQPLIVAFAPEASPTPRGERAVSLLHPRGFTFPTTHCRFSFRALSLLHLAGRLLQSVCTIWALAQYRCGPACIAY